jgi:hypothetical protein
MGKIIVYFDVTDQLLITYSAFVNIGEMGQYVSYL